MKSISGAWERIGHLHLCLDGKQLMITFMDFAFAQRGRSASIVMFFPSKAK